MLEELCRECRNWFARDLNRHSGRFEIVDGVLSPDCDLKNGQYFRIVGSAFNDGVWLFPSYSLVDEAFDGAVWAMDVPPSFVALAAEISDWKSKYGESSHSPYQSESFGGYSYAKGGGDGAGSTWQSVFKSELSRWRKI